MTLDINHRGSNFFKPVDVLFYLFSTIIYYLDVINFLCMASELIVLVGNGIYFNEQFN